MPLKRYRVIVTVLCPQCVQAKQEGRIRKDCRTCQHIKYNNVTRLKSFVDFLDKNHPTWAFFKVYEYIKGSPGRELAHYRNWYNKYLEINGKYVSQGRFRDLPMSDQI